MNRAIIPRGEDEEPYLTQCPGEAERADALEVPDQIDTLAPVAAREVGALVDVGAAVTT